MYKKIKNLDKFGHKVELNFNLKGSEHKTWIGAICSILVNIFIFIYVLELGEKLVYNGDDQLQTVTKYVEPMSLDPIPI